MLIKFVAKSGLQVRQVKMLLVNEQASQPGLPFVPKLHFLQV
jgi:hypothetical protein